MAQRKQIKGAAAAPKREQAEAQEDSGVLARLKNMYEQAASSSAYTAWQAEAAKAWRFYDGEQWTAEEIDKLADSGQPPIVINKLANKVDNIAGSEVMGRTRIVYRSRSGAASEEQTARALSDLALYVAERSEQPIELSHMFKAGLVTGIGWLDVGVETADEGVNVFSRMEDEMQVVFDSNSRRADFSDGRFVCRTRWLAEDDVLQMFGEKAAKLIEQMSAGPVFTGAQQRSVFGQKAGGVHYLDSENKLFLVVEVQYKQLELQYSVRQQDGKQFVTFSKKAAYTDLNNKVESALVPRVYMGYFSGDVLLQHVPSPYQHNHFTLIPYVYKRKASDGRPYGLVQAALDPQKELNKRRARALHLLNTAQVIADIDAVEDPNILAREAARPDGLILKRPGKELRILRNSDLAQSQVAVMEQATRDIQEVMGVFDESLGKQSNATSGIAIAQRQVAGSMNQMFAFDAFRRTKKKLGQDILSLIRQFFTHEMVIHITDQFGAPKMVRLNHTVRDAMGKEVMDEVAGMPLKIADVQAGVFDIHVEEVRDALSSREHDLQQLELLRAAGVPVPLKTLVEATSINNKQDLLASIEQAETA